MIDVVVSAISDAINSIDNLGGVLFVLFIAAAIIMGKKDPAKNKSKGSSNNSSQSQQ